MTYTIYELKLKPLSSWITDLTADTIFGHLCWQIKYEFGGDVFKEFLKEMEEKEKEPIFTISDVLPADRLPRPLTEFDFDKNEGNKRSYKRNKKYNKDIRLVSFSDFQRYFLGKKINSDNILNAKKKINKDTIKFSTLEIENKNVIDRNSFTTGNNGIYSLSTNEPYGLLFSLYIKIFNKDKFERYKIEKLLKNIFEVNGYGKKKSTGKGIFIIEKVNKDFIKEFYGIEKNEIKESQYENILLLSNFIPSKTDPTNGNYKLFTKFPKLGEEFSLEGHNFYKKPLVMIQTGATFEKPSNYKGYVGKMIKNVDFENIGVYHYAYGFTLEF